MTDVSVIAYKISILFCFVLFSRLIPGYQIQGSDHVSFLVKSTMSYDVGERVYQISKALSRLRKILRLDVRFSANTFLLLSLKYDL